MRDAGGRCLLSFGATGTRFDSACEKVARTLYCVNEFPANAAKFVTIFAHSVIRDRSWHDQCRNETSEVDSTIFAEVLSASGASSATSALRLCVSGGSQNPQRRERGGAERSAATEKRNLKFEI
jgi:hypothetical protein